MLMFSIHHLEETIVLMCAGRIRDSEEADALSELASDLLRRHGQITINLVDIDHIDSEGMHVLAYLALLARHIGGKVRFAGLKQNAINDLSSSESVAEIFLH